MDDLTGDVRAGAPRVPRVRRSRKEEQEHVRNVLAALGGSSEEYDRAHSPSETDASLGSRLAAYSRLARTATASAEAVAAPTARPTETQRKLEPVPRPVRPKRERRRRQRPSVATHVRHAVRALAHVVATMARQLVRAVVGSSRALRALAIALVRSAARAILLPIHLLVRVVLGAARLLAHVTLGGVRGLRLSLSRAAAVVRRSLVRTAHVGRASVVVVLRAAVHGVQLPGRAVRQLGRARPRARVALLRPSRSERREDRVEPTRVAEAVLTWVQAPSQPSAKPAAHVPEEDASPVEPEPEVPAVAPPIVTAPPLEDRLERSRRKPLAALAIVTSAVALVAGGAFTLTHHEGSAAATPSAAKVEVPQSVPTRSEFSDPRKYGAAMTRLALLSGRTQVDGQVACNQESTFDRWTCQARGKPSLGAYAGVWLTYRCSPNSTPQPGGRPAAVMINCKPLNPPSLSA